MGNPPWDLRVSEASNGDDDEVADDELRNMSLRSDHVIMEDGAPRGVEGALRVAKHRAMIFSGAMRRMI